MFDYHMKNWRCSLHPEGEGLLIWHCWSSHFSSKTQLIKQPLQPKVTACLWKHRQAIDSAKRQYCIWSSQLLLVTLTTLNISQIISNLFLSGFKLKELNQEGLRENWWNRRGSDMAFLFIRQIFSNITKHAVFAISEQLVGVGYFNLYASRPRKACGWWIQ